ncbi:MAG: flavodoxin family protein [Deltaproteobacteria bacterium]|nr:flavodoxin family protein [Deltaproteobacteria bacterium]
MINLVAIAGSPVNDSNTTAFLAEALKVLEGKEDVAVTVFDLSKMNVGDCRQCNWCLARQTEDRFCVLDDDMAIVLPKVRECDGLILATPVYFARMSGYLAAAIDRMRCLHYGRVNKGGMQYKVGAALAVSWFRNSGLETALNSLLWAFATYQMIIAFPGSVSTFGGAGVASPHGEGRLEGDDRHQVLQDRHGIIGAQETVRAMLKLVRLVKAGQKALGQTG